MEDMEEAILSLRQALTVHPPGHPQHSASLSNLAIALGDRFGQLGRMEDLEEQISCHRKALTLRPPGHPQHSASLSNLAIALGDRFGQLGRMEDLEEQISCHRKALTLRPPGHPQHSASLSNLACALGDRFGQLGRMEDLEEAISCHRKALTLRPPGHPQHSASLSNLASALIDRFRQLGRMEDLEEAISCHRKALTLCPPGHPEHSASLSNLACALGDRFWELGRMEDLEEAISCHRKALTLRPPGHPQHSASLSNLAGALVDRFRQLGRMKDLEEAISCHRKALTLRPPGHPQHSASLSNLASALIDRFRQLGRMEDLEEAISCHRKALTLCPPGHPEHSASLSNLASALSNRFRQLGRMEDLEEAISCHRKALTLCPPGHPEHSASLSNLASALSNRFRQLGRMEDLEEAISCHRKALTLRPPGHPQHSASLSNLASALIDRFRQLGRMEDLEEAISCLRKALTLRPPGHPQHSASLSNLASALIVRFGQLGRMEDLEEAISCHRKALTLCPPGHPQHSASLSNLAGALSDRFWQLGRMEDLEEAISCHRKALTLCPPGHPEHSASLANLASALGDRFRQLGSQNDLAESFSLYEQAATDHTSNSSDQLTAAVHWAAMARRCHHSSVIHAYSTSFRLLGRCLIFHPDVDSQQKFLASANVPKSLASDAASAAINVGELEAAVELLEAGRAILWSRIGGYRHPLNQLRLADGELANRLETLSIDLERLELSSRPRQLAIEGYSAPAAVDAQIRRHRILSEEREAVVGEVRKIDGFANFLQPVPFPTLRTAAAEGPIILINISQYRSDAIILHADYPHPILVPLPNAQPQHLIQLAKQLAQARDGVRDNPSKYFLPILHDLWTDVISPVHDRLMELGVPEKTRVWWCPTSELCALPLHAAGLYQRNQKNLPDIYISSYIATISTLMKARSNMLNRTISPRLLAIGQPETLPRVQEEIDHIEQLGDFTDVIISEEANRDRILQGLQQHSWAHFACHGHLGEKGQPFQASFELHGGSRLTLLDLMQARLPHAELAFLSACHSAAGDLTTPDETIHLAAALQFCGFRSVVGTLWAMDDEDGPTISKEFYKHMFRDPRNGADFRDSAEALSLAIREMRKNRVPLHRWIMFVHIGA